MQPKVRANLERFKVFVLGGPRGLRNGEAAVRTHGFPYPRTRCFRPSAEVGSTGRQGTFATACAEGQRTRAAPFVQASLSSGWPGSSGQIETMLAPSTLPNLTKGNPTWQLAKLRRKDTVFRVAHPPFSSSPRLCCSSVTKSCGKPAAQGSKKRPDATAMVRPPTNTSVILPSTREART
jgi:hypothetical protein